MNKKIFTLLWLVVSILFFVSCSDDDNPTAPEEKSARELSAKEITIPEAMQNSQDPHAQIAKVWIGLANTFKNYSAFYQPPEGNSSFNKLYKANDEWTQTWESGGMVIKMDYYENESVFGWKIYITGNDGEYVFNDWLYLEAEQAIDDSYGVMKMYKPVTDEVGMEWNWSTETNGTYNFTLLLWNDDSSEKLEIISNPDNSGEMTAYNYNNGQYIMELKITWTAAGTGYYWEYDENGDLVDEGPF